MHAAHQAGKHVEAEIAEAGAVREDVEEGGTGHVEAGVGPGAFRGGGFFLEFDDAAGFVADDDAALAGVGRLEEGEGEFRVPVAMEADEGGERGVGEIIGVDDQEIGFVHQPIAVCADGAGAAEQDWFVEEGDRHGGGGACGDEGLNLAGQMMGVDARLGHAQLFELPEPDVEQGLAADGEEAFGRVVGEGPQTGADTGCEEERLHVRPGPSGRRSCRAFSVRHRP